MANGPEDVAGGEAPLPIFAHIEDSVPPAEHLWPPDLAQRLTHISKRPKTPGNLLERAWTYNEYALATPEFEGDDELFRLGRLDLKRILQKDLGPRHQTRFAANLLLHYEDAFRLRANSQPITKSVRRNLRRNLGGLMLDFLGEKELLVQEYGQLCELVATTYLLNSNIFPYIASRREEANMIQADNHDIYTIHPCAKNRIKKAPASIKFCQEVKSTQVVGLTIGGLALETALRVPEYAENDKFHDDKKQGNAVRLAADIMVCQSSGEKLDEADTTFSSLLTGALCSRMMKFANQSTTPDYASNAEALRQEIAAREAAQAAVRETTQNNG